MQNDASSTRLSLRLPLEELVPIYEKAKQNGSTFFGYVAGLISRELNLSAMSIDLSPSCQHLRLSLTLPVSEAVKLHNAAQKEKLAAGDWVAHLLQQNTPVSPSRDLSPIGQKNSR